MHTGWRTLLLAAGAVAGLIGGPPPTPWVAGPVPTTGTWRAPSGLVIDADGRCAPHGTEAPVAWITLDATDVPQPDAPPARDRLVLLDRSGSMATDGRMARARAALASLAQTAPADDRLGVVVYGDRAHTVLPLQRGWTHEDVERAVDRVFVGGASHLDRGLREALRALDGATPGATTLLVLTDGPPNAGPLPSPLLRERLAEAGTEVVVIGLSDDVGSQPWSALGAAPPRPLTDLAPLIEQLPGGGAPPPLAADLRVSWRFDGPTGSGPWLGPVPLGPVRPGERRHQALPAAPPPEDAAPEGADRVALAVHATHAAPEEPQLTVAWGPSPGDRTDGACQGAASARGGEDR